MIKTTIKNSPVHIIDNAIPTQHLESIQTWIKTKANFTNYYKEYRESKHIHFGMPVKQGTLQQTFLLQHWFTDYLTAYEPRATLSQKVKSDMPVFSHGSKVSEHQDFIGVNDDTFYVSSTLFLNPLDKDKNSGLFLEDQYFHNVYNRLIIHSGHIKHKVRVPDNNSLRLTLDIHISNATIDTNQTYENNLVTFIK